LSYVLAYVLLGVPLAYFGFGAWSLVVAQLVQSLLTVVLAYLQVRHPIRPFLAPRPAGFLSFGSKIMGVNLVNHAIRDMDSVFVASVFGTTSLGLYNRAYVLVATPMNSLMSVLQGVLFPVYSRFQEDSAILKQGYLASVGATALVILPVFVSVAAVPWTVVEGLYGDQWLDAVPFLIPLALVMSFQALLSPAGPIFWGKGLVGRELRIQAVVAILLVMVLLATSRLSLVTLVWGVLGVYLVRFLLITSAALLIVGGTWWEMLGTLRGSFLLSVGTMLAVLGVDSFLGWYDVASFVRLLGDVFTGTAVAVVVLTFIPRFVLSKEVLWAFDHIAHKLPWILRRSLERARSREDSGSSAQGVKELV
jgi:PST family polysaccharide transporter